MTRTVLITGCSSGIGRSLALELHNRGLKVYATARRPETLDDLEQRGLKILGLDVNDDTSIAAAMTQVESDVGQLDMLVNNGGFSQVGAIVDLQREDLRQQYETNVIAPVAVTRAALPLMRKAVAANGAADLVNVGSIVGLLTTPFAGAYCSSKACVHSITDALRMELAPFGIRTITIQPGGVRSSFGDHAEEGMRLPEGSVYEPMQARIQARAQAGQQGATPTDEFIKPVVDKLLKAKPPMVIRGGKGSFLLVTLKRFLPARAFDQLMAKRFGLAGFQPGEG